MSEKKYYRPRSVVWPIVLIGLGLVFLLNNLGVVSWNVWGVMLRLWPVLLVAIGIDLIFGRRSGVGAAISAVLIVALFAGAFWMVDATGTMWAGDQVSHLISQSIGEADQAEIGISLNIGELGIEAMPASSDLLIEGKIQVGEYETVTDKLRMMGDIADYTLSTQGIQFRPAWVFSPGDDGQKKWDLRLNGEIPIDLSVDTGVGRSVLDLSGIVLTSLDVDSGVGEVIVTLPKEGSYTVRVNGGIGALKVILPAGVEARVVVDTGLGSTSISGDLSYRNGAYYSAGYEEADEQVEIFVDGGVGEIEITLND